MALIKYVGSKPRKQDTVAGTGIWWLGNGDVQDVPDKAVARLLMHPDVWAQAEVSAGAGLVNIAGSEPGASGQPAGQPGTQPASEPARFVLDGPSGAVALDPMDDAAVKAWVAEHLEPHGIKVDGRLKGDKLKAAVIEAVKAAGAEG